MSNSFAYGVTAAGIALFAYWTWQVIYNLFLHPLAHSPGPRLTAATKIYEFYYDVVKGPIVRINPDEVHVNDAAYYDTVYAGPGHKRDKYVWFADAAGGSPTSAFATQHHDLHRSRRSALNPFFSKASVMSLEPMIHDKIDRVCSIMHQHYQNGTAVEFGAAYMSFALDTVTHYAFGKSGCWGCLDGEGFAGEWKEAIIEAFENATLVRYIPWMTPILLRIPYQWIVKCHKSMGMFYKSAEMIRGIVHRFLAQEKTDTERTIFSSLRNGSLPPGESAPQRLLDEANILIAAGGEAITQLPSVISFHMCDNLHVVAVLRKELVDAFPDGASSVTLEKAQSLSYLTAVITEGLRISAIVTTRLPRIAPNQVLQYGSYSIPAGTPVSMTSHFIHLDPKIWPEPLRFLPERWTSEETPGR
ncbi:Isotrichodermin C-15 hydroxylase [Sphaceloma murrayae]|uniref:Isotrichodermin C-15 hydroxylase n=1 Tax=Sphaceloma murrayae TaxID=2082308 RepID=A0A2K1QZ92_9PEZI|nr:Isotrichodermin C-15 hydroxylase [Sphaceloma murrayae]